MSFDLPFLGTTLEAWIKNMRTRFAKLIQTRSGQGARDLTQRDAWIKETFSFLRPHIVRVATRTSKVSIKAIHIFSYCIFIHVKQNNVKCPWTILITCCHTYSFPIPSHKPVHIVDIFLNVHVKQNDLQSHRQYLL